MVFQSLNISFSRIQTNELKHRNSWKKKSSFQVWGDETGITRGSENQCFPFCLCPCYSDLFFSATHFTCFQEFSIVIMFMRPLWVLKFLFQVTSQIYILPSLRRPLVPLNLLHVCLLFLLCPETSPGPLVEQPEDIPDSMSFSSLQPPKKTSQ